MAKFDTTLPVINSFTASPTVVSLGEMVTFSWTTANANSVKISDDDKYQSPKQAANGSFPYAPTDTADYTLTATGDAGTTESDPVTVTVIDDPPEAKRRK